MNLKTKIAATVLMFGSASMAQATTYDVMGEFNEPNAAVFNTTFTGSFDWDGSTLTNLMGTMNSSMDSTIEDLNLGGMGSAGFGGAFGNFVYGMVGTVVTASLFKEATDDVFAGGGYATGSMYKFGSTGMMGSPDDSPNVANENAYFSFSFDTAGMALAADVSSIVYGDCSPDGLMMMGEVCMTGNSAGGTMGATPLDLQISAVPVPAAAWLFGGALISLFGANRRKSVLPA